MTKFSPHHYRKGNIEVWDFVADQDLDYFRGCIVKYVCRAGSKQGETEIEDLRKAHAYLDKAIYLLDQNNDASERRCDFSKANGTACECSFSEYSEPSGSAD